MLAELYIENELVDLNDSVTFSLTKQFEDITDPTTIINDWSKTVSIPFSTKNNKLFGHIYNLDRVIVNYNNYIQKLKYSYSGSLSEKDWDNENGTLSFNGGNNSLNSISCYLHDTDEDYDYPLVTSITTAGYYTMSFSKDDYYNEVKVIFNSTQTSSIFTMDISSLSNGRYSLSFYLSSINTTDKTAVLRNFVLVSGNTAVSGEDAYYLKGIHFNPLKKINFRLEWDKSVLMEGYAKMNDVRYVDGVGSYNITLFGELGKVFSDMKKISFDTSREENTEYIIPKDQYIHSVINKNLIQSSFQYSQSQLNLSSATIYDIIGFAPSAYSYNDEFDSKSIQTVPLSGETKAIKYISDWLSSTASTMDYKTVVGDGLLPRQAGELRSYYQLPYIYFNKLFQIFQAKFESLSDYKFDLDSSWFNYDNPYWRKLIYMLKPLSSNEDKTNTNTYTMTGYQKMFWTVPNWTATSSTRYVLNTANEKVAVLNNSGGIMKFKIGNDYSINLAGTLPIVPYYPIQQTDPYLNPENALIVTLTFTGSNGYTTNYKILMKSTNCTLDIPSDYADITYTVDPQGTSLPYISSSDRGWVLNHPLNIFLAKGKYGDEVTMTVSSNWYNNNTPVLTSNVEVILPQASINGYVSYDVKRSYTNIFLNDFWDNNYNIFEEILKYCKRFRILIKVDTYNKLIKFIHSPNYFSNYTIADWTDKIDKSKDYTIKPVSFEDKYILFNYDDIKLRRNTEYSEKYGYNYGEIRLETDYNFSDDVKDMFPDENYPSILATENILDLNHIKDNSFLYQFSVSESFIDNTDDSNRPLSLFGSYFFRDGTKQFDSDLINVYATDDTELQQNTNTYCYLDIDNSSSGDYTRLYYYPAIYTVVEGKACIFTKPKEYYTYTNPYSSSVKGIYEGIWKKYLDERYYENNKLITCYLKLTPSDYMNFDYNHFIVIGNQLYMINKIYDYDVSSTQSTKVDLITVHNVSGYTTT